MLSSGRTAFVGLVGLGDHPAHIPAGVWASNNGTAWEEVDLASEVFVAAAASSGEVEVLASNGTGGAVFFVRNARG